MFKLIAIPLGYVMKWCYLLVKNYGVALILFTIITRLVVLPLQIKQQKSSARMAKLNPQLKKLQQKYSKNKEKYQEEMMKLYSKEHVSPMASCLPMLITFLILFALIEVIYSPLYYISGINQDTIKKSDTMITQLYTVSSAVDSDGTTIEELVQKIADENSGKTQDELDDLLVDKLNSYSSVEKLDMSESETEKIVETINNHNDIDKFMLNTEYISKSLASNRSELLNFSFVNKDDGRFADVLDDDVREVVEDFDYTLFGIFLGDFPKWNGFNSDSLLVLVPILSFLAQMGCTVVSQYYMKKNNTDAAGNMGGGMKAMFYIMPLFSLFIAFNFPAGLGIYWIMSSVLAFGQTIFLNVVYTPDHVAEMIEKEDLKKKQSGKMSMMEKALELQNQQNGGSKSDDYVDVEDNDYNEEEVEEKKLSKSELKEMQRNKLNEARRRMAEKYGDEYNDNDD